MRRGKELAAIQATLQGRPGQCGTLLLGDAGVGKTTLARMAAHALRTPAVWVAGTESAREVPLGVFAHLLASPMSADVPPTSHALPLINVFRDDVVTPSLPREDVLAAAPAVEDARFRVPRILAEEA